MTRLSPRPYPKVAVYSSLSHLPFYPIMLAEVDKLGLLVEATQPSYIPSIM